METTGTGNGKSHVAFGLVLFLLFNLALVLSASVDETEEQEKAELESHVKDEESQLQLEAKDRVRLCIRIKIKIRIYRRPDMNSQTDRSYNGGETVLVTEEENEGGNKWFKTNKGWIPVTRNNKEYVIVSIKNCRKPELTA